jgi:hypothetical protein
LIVLEVLLAVGAYGGVVMILVQPDDLLPAGVAGGHTVPVLGVAWVLPGIALLAANGAVPTSRPGRRHPSSVLGDPGACCGRRGAGGLDSYPAAGDWLLAPAFQLGYFTLGLVILGLDCLAFGLRTGPARP